MLLLANTVLLNPGVNSWHACLNEVKFYDQTFSQNSMDLN